MWTSEANGPQVEDIDQKDRSARGHNGPETKALPCTQQTSDENRSPDRSCSGGCPGQRDEQQQHPLERHVRRRGVAPRERAGNEHDRQHANRRDKNRDRQVCGPPDQRVGKPDIRTADDREKRKVDERRIAEDPGHQRVHVRRNRAVLGEQIAVQRTAGEDRVRDEEVVPLVVEEELWAEDHTGAIGD